MARLSAATALLLLLFSLLAVAHCRRVLEAEPATDAAEASSDVASPDEQGLPKLAVPEEAGPTDVVIPTHRAAPGEAFLGLPSHWRHRHPCHHGHELLHRNPLWARHHGVILQDVYRFHRHGGAHLTVNVPAELPHEEEPKDAEEEVKAVAEPDPDHSHPDTDGEQEIDEETKKRPFHGVEKDDDETVRPWKREMWRRFRHSHRFHHRRHHHENHEQDQEGAGAMKRFHHHHQDEEQEDEETGKRFHHDDHDSDVDEEEEEMARRWRKAIMRRGRRFHFHHGRRFHHHHQHVEEADEQEEGGVMRWLKDLMNRF